MNDIDAQATKVDFLLKEINLLLERLEQDNLSAEEKIILDQYCEEFFGYIEELKLYRDKTKAEIIELQKMKKAQKAYTQSDI